MMGRPSGALRIIVLGYVIRGPLGGMVWYHLQYLQGLAELGHEVYFLEDSDDYPSCYDPERGFTDVDPTYGLRFASCVFEPIGFKERWAYHDAHQRRWHGPRGDDMMRMCAEADLLINLACVNPIRPWVAEIPVRIYLDQDPAFNQVRHLIDSKARESARQHNVFFSFGENVARGDALVPSDSFPWMATRQPVLLSSVPASAPCKDGKFTTVMQWQSYPAVEYGGHRYGMKSDSFMTFLDLPSRTGPVFDLAIGGGAPRELLQSKGWSLHDPIEVSRDLWTYETFIRSSKAEFGIAKHGYVEGRTGWFSERSVFYLATGRPVLAHETGFSDWLKTHGGVLPFRTASEAAAAIAEVNRRYDFHCRSAREVATEYFDACKVLPDLIERAMNATPCDICTAG
jgi:hypothetical protein